MFRGLFQSPRLVVTAACLVAFLAWLGAMWPRQAPLEVTFLDVGQGDCAVVKAPSGRVMLIDGGGVPEGIDSRLDVGGKIVLPYLRRQGIRCIDLMVLSHPHEDHLAGLVTVLDKMPVRSVVEPSVPHGSPLYSKFLATIKRKHIRRIIARRGMGIKLDRYTTADVLNPAEEEASGYNANDSSVVMLLRCHGVRMLFAGDCESSSEQTICDSVANLRADVLKVGHHGSANASGSEWLHRVGPRIAVISAGRNNLFGHPSPLTLKRLEAIGCRIYRTDIHGAVRITVGGRKMSIRTFASDR